MVPDPISHFWWRAYRPQSFRICHFNNRILEGISTVRVKECLFYVHVYMYVGSHSVRTLFFESYQCCPCAFSEDVQQRWMLPAPSTGRHSDHEVSLNAKHQKRHIKTTCTYIGPSWVLAYSNAYFPIT